MEGRQTNRQQGIQRPSKNNDWHNGDGNDAFVVAESTDAPGLWKSASLCLSSGETFSEAGLRSALEAPGLSPVVCRGLSFWSCVLSGCASVVKKQTRTQPPSYRLRPGLDRLRVPPRAAAAEPARPGKESKEPGSKQKKGRSRKFLTLDA